jgi:hypothetical protein
MELICDDNYCEDKKLKQKKQKTITDFSKFKEEFHNKQRLTIVQYTV